MELNENGEFRFISAGHPLPLIYSYKHDAVCHLHSSSYASSLPMSMFPSDKALVEINKNTINIFNHFTTNKSSIPRSGDLVILYSDGFSEHANNKGELYFDPSPEGKGGRLQEVINENKNLEAEDLYYIIKDDLLKFGKQDDDISFVIIKKE